MNEYKIPENYIIVVIDQKLIVSVLFSSSFDRQLGGRCRSGARARGPHGLSARAQRRQDQVILR